VEVQVWMAAQHIFFFSDLTLFLLGEVSQDRQYRLAAELIVPNNSQHMLCYETGNSYRI